MTRLAYPLAFLAVCAAFQAQAAAGDNPPPGLLAKIQIANHAHQGSGSARREFKDMTKFARENGQALDGGHGGVSIKKVGSLDVSKLNHDRAHTPAASGEAVGGRANDGGRD